MNNPDTLTTQLHARGYRLTPQRLAILKILNDAEIHLTPIEVYQRASEAIPGITEATVYRTLGFLAEQGLALEAHVGNGQLVYVSPEHNHVHIICRDCGQMAEVECGTVRAFSEHFQAETGYWIDINHLTLFGLCPECQEGQPFADVNPCTSSYLEK